MPSARRGSGGNSPPPGSISTLSGSVSGTSTCPTFRTTGTLSSSAQGDENEDEEIYSSDEEDYSSDPDNHSVGSDEEDFNELMVAENFLNDRWLFAKQFHPDDTESLDNKHSLVLQVGLDENVEIKQIPDDYVPPNRKPGQPEFNDVDNPGDWPEYVFRPKFNKKKEYQGHFLPAGATTVPDIPDVGRMIEGWTFFYGAVPNLPNLPNIYGNSYRSGARTENLFPESRKGSLDPDILEAQTFRQ